MKMCEDFAPNFFHKRTGACTTTTHRLALPFSPGNFSYQRQHGCRPPPTLLFSTSRLKIKLRGRQLDSIQLINAELQAVLNTLTDHDFQDAF
jgi:hypothetical protein